MATNYSLICWGGRTGKVVTMTIASPCVVTSTNHGLRDGTGLVFSTTGALPTGITSGATYYAKNTAANTFNLYTDAALTSIVNTSGTQSGTHTAKSKKMLDYFTQYSGRWGASGSERCYDGLAAWNIGRSGASGLDVEYCEIGESFINTFSSEFTVSIPSAKNIITTSINGVRTPAFHGGVVDGGFVCRLSVADGTPLRIPRIGDEVDGVDVHLAYLLYGSRRGITAGPNSRVTNCILRCETNTLGVGVYLTGTKSEVSNSLILNFNIGITCDAYQNDSVIDNNIVARCVTGIGFGSAAGGAGNKMDVRNNISLGNTTNWATGATNLKNATNNLGLTGEAWISSGGTRLETTETAPFASIFADYDNNDFRPASASSPQVDAGVEYYGIASTDIASDERPNYNNGGTEAVDVGCYEFDHGYGPHPATLDLTLTGVLAGSEVRIYAVSDGTELAGTESCVSSPTFTFTANVQVRILVISTIYRLIDFVYSAGSGTASIPIEMSEDPWFKDPV